MEQKGRERESLDFLFHNFHHTSFSLCITFSVGTRTCNTHGTFLWKQQIVIPEVNYAHFKTQRAQNQAHFTICAIGFSKLDYRKIFLLLAKHPYDALKSAWMRCVEFPLFRLRFYFSNFCFLQWNIFHSAYRKIQFNTTGNSWNALYVSHMQRI